MKRQWQYKGAYIEVTDSVFDKNELVGKLYFPDRLAMAMRGEEGGFVDLYTTIRVREWETKIEAANRLEARLRERTDVLVRWNAEDDDERTKG